MHSFQYRNLFFLKEIKIEPDNSYVFLQIRFRKLLRTTIILMQVRHEIIFLYQVL